jgi:hypothetical protein
MASPICHCDKGFDQGTHRHFALRLLPPLRNDLTFVIDQEVRNVRIRKLLLQHGCRRL